MSRQETCLILSVAILQMHDFRNNRSEWYLLGRRVAAQWKVGDHLLISKLIPLCALDHSIQHQDIPIGFTERLRYSKVWGTFEGLKSLKVNWLRMFTYPNNIYS